MTLFLSLRFFHSVPFTVFFSLWSFHSIPFTLSFHSVSFTLVLSLCSFLSSDWRLILTYPSKKLYDNSTVQLLTVFFSNNAALTTMAVMKL